MRIIFSILTFILTIGISNITKAELVLDLNRGVSEPLPLAVATFYSEGGEIGLAQQIPQLISENLEKSGLFSAVNPRAFVQTSESMEKEGIRFGEWRAINAQGLISGKVIAQSGGKARVEFRLWDVFSQKQLIGMAYTTDLNNWRRIAHIISDEIYKRLTGEDGYFDTRIVYIAEQGAPHKRIKRLAIMDQDGENHKYLTDGS